MDSEDAPAPAAAAAAAARRRSLALYLLLLAALVAVGVFGSFFSPVWPVLMCVTLAASCLVQAVRLLAEIGPALPLVGFAFRGGGAGRYHAVQPEHPRRRRGGSAADDADTAAAFELQRQVLALSASPALARVLRAIEGDRNFTGEDFQILNELDNVWGAEPSSGAQRALRPEQIAALPQWAFAGAEKAAPAAAPAACAICLEPYEPGERLRTLPCVHSFHAACVDRWLGISGLCPECRGACAAGGGGGGGGGGGAAAAGGDPWAPQGHALV